MRKRSALHVAPPVFSCDFHRLSGHPSPKLSVALPVRLLPLEIDSPLEARNLVPVSTHIVNITKARLTAPQRPRELIILLSRLQSSQKPLSVHPQILDSLPLRLKQPLQLASPFATSAG